MDRTSSGQWVTSICWWSPKRRRRRGVWPKRRDGNGTRCDIPWPTTSGTLISHRCRTARVEFCGLSCTRRSLWRKAPSRSPIATDGAHGSEITVGKGAARAFVPCREHLLLYTCVHFAWSHMMSFGAWRSFRDVVALNHAGIDWGFFEAEVQRNRAASSAYWTLRLAERLASAEVPSDTMKRLARSTDSMARGMTERHLEGELFSGQSECPSVSLRRLLWEAAICPGGHCTAAPGLGILMMSARLERGSLSCLGECTGVWSRSAPPFATSERWSATPARARALKAKTTCRVVRGKWFVMNLVVQLPVIPPEQRGRMSNHSGAANVGIRIVAAVAVSDGVKRPLGFPRA